MEQVFIPSGLLKVQVNLFVLIDVSGHTRKIGSGTDNFIRLL